MSPRDSRLADDDDVVESFDEEPLESAESADFEEEAVEEEEAAPKKRGLVVREKPRANVYTMMLVMSFIFIVIACVYLGLEFEEYHHQLRP